MTDPHDGIVPAAPLLMRPAARIRDWNVVATARDGRRYGQALSALDQLGTAGRTSFMDVLVLRTDEPRESLLERYRELDETVARLVPAERAFDFQTPEEFEDRAREILGGWIERFAGRSFHVRMHRRGFKGRISSMTEERELAGFILDALERSGRTARVTFEDPDLVLDVETVGQRAGLSIWTRDELRRFPFVKAG